MKDYRVLDGGVPVAIDGLWYHAPEKARCAHCPHITKEGITAYYHSATAAAIERPGSGFVLPLAGEFISNGDGGKKRDCELKASKRWLEKHAQEYKRLKPALLGDDLHVYEPFCALIPGKSMGFIFTRKDSTHKRLAGTVKNSYLGEKTETKRTGGKKMMYIYRFTSHVPVKYEEKDGNNLFVNYFSLEIKEAGGEKSTFKSRITDKAITDDNVAAPASYARARRRIENEHNNALKNRGYNLEHNFGHGDKHASGIFFLLNIPAFRFHTILEYAYEKYGRARSVHYTGKVFFEIPRPLTILVVFDSRDHLLDYMSHEHHEIKPIQPG